MSRLRRWYANKRVDREFPDATVYELPLPEEQLLSTRIWDALRGVGEEGVMPYMDRSESEKQEAEALRREVLEFRLKLILGTIALLSFVLMVLRSVG